MNTSGVDNELELMSNVTMVMLIRQMSDMVGQAEQMFSDLEKEIKRVETTSRRIQYKVRNLQSNVDKLDCLEEKVGKELKWYTSPQSILIISGDLDSCKRNRKHYSTKYFEDDNLFLPNTRPTAVARLYEDSEKKIDASKEVKPDDSSYLCIPIKSDVNCKYFNVETETKRVSVSLHFMPFISKITLTFKRS